MMFEVGDIVTDRNAEDNSCEVYTVLDVDEFLGRITIRYDSSDCRTGGPYPIDWFRHHPYLSKKVKTRSVKRTSGFSSFVKQKGY